MRLTTHHLIHFADDIDSFGVAANETAIANVVDDARAVAAGPVLLSVLSDPTQPEVARARAFGMVATIIAAAHAAERSLPADHEIRPLEAVAS